MNGTLKREFKKLWWLLLFPLAFVTKELAFANPALVESVYSTGAYPGISAALQAFSGGLPFSVAEFLLWMIISAAVVLIIFAVINTKKHGFRLAKFARALIICAIVAAVLLNSFYILWGYNYSRQPLAESLGIEVKERGAGELEELCTLLANTANYCRSRVSEDENGIFRLSGGRLNALKSTPAWFAALGEAHSVFAGPAKPPKPMAASRLMSNAGLSGIYIPFTGEANVNMNQRDLMIPVSAAHETAHMIGIAREDEANFAAYLACMYSGDIEIRYSGVIMALINAGNALSKVDKEAYVRLNDSYSPGVLRDLADHSDFWQTHKGGAKKAADVVNDTYLKSQKQDDGLKSYGRMVDLLLAYYSESL